MAQQLGKSQLTALYELLDKLIALEVSDADDPNNPLMNKASR
jgi:hypothetical protein